MGIAVWAFANDGTVLCEGDGGQRVALFIAYLKVVALLLGDAPVAASGGWAVSGCLCGHGWRCIWGLCLW